MRPLLKIEMFGGMRVQIEERDISRFPTQKAVALLAYLAYFPDPHPRETLVELLWPGGTPESGRASLSQALSMLRRQLEPPGLPTGAAIVATKSHVGINSGGIETDVSAFQRALRRARTSSTRSDQTEALRGAIDLYRGELLSGFYEDWVQTEQRRLADAYFQAVDTLLGLLRESNDLPAAIEYARRAVGVDPLREASHCEVMRLCAAAGRPADALQQYLELKRLLEQEFGAEPSAGAQKLAREIERLEGDSPHLPVPTPKAKRLAPLPRGTVTFLFTDIEGSTKLWEQSGAAFHRALEEHHLLLRKCFAEYAGHEVKEAGDSFLVAFESPSSAMTCAIACQKSVESLELRAERTEPQNSQPSTLNPQLKVRMALHTGEVKLEEGEYHGLALHRASRILTAAHGGQVVGSESFASMVRRDLPAGVRLIDLGIYRLRDVQAPDRLFQVNYDQMPQSEFPPLNAEAGYQSNLPLQFTRFFGRDAQIAQLSEMLQAGDTRLVTVTGTGGTGKTRLALEVANRMLEPFAGAVWFVPLVDLTDPELIAGAIIDSMRIPRSPHAEPMDQAAEALNRQPSLLILDNLEQFVEDAGRLVRDLLERVPTLTCLVTSRQSLSLTAEREFALAPLMTPNGSDTPERLTMFESVRLFVDRAQAVKPDFQVTNQNAPAVAELCDRLEGIPLAIELAAARAGVLAPSQMLLQLDKRFDFLVGRKRDAQSRHYTLRAAIDWSYQLLPAETQQFFARLSVFRGGWTLEAAEAVCDEPDALAQLQHLMECSLIRSQETETGMRFRMLESLREFAATKLSVEETHNLSAAHLDFYATLTAGLEGTWETDRLKDVLPRLHADIDNVWLALEFSKSSADLAPGGQRLVGQLFRICEKYGYFREAERHARELLAIKTDPSMIAARGAALLLLCNVRIQAGVVTDLRAVADELVKLWHGLGDRGKEFHAMLILGSADIALADFRQGRMHLEQALELTEFLPDRARARCIVLNNLGEVFRNTGEADLARKYYELATAEADSIGHSGYMCGCIINLARMDLLEGNLIDAERRLRAALRTAQGITYLQCTRESLYGLGAIRSRKGDGTSAARLIGAGDAMNETYGMEVQEADRVDYDGWVAEAKAAMGEAAYLTAWREGHSMPLDAAVELALGEPAG
jgi:predicted ATPase/DNA-binding SARP family transcriptional activator